MLIVPPKTSVLFDIDGTLLRQPTILAGLPKKGRSAPDCVSATAPALTFV